ncbi:MAG: ABC transporter permease [Bacteroidetes bacterium]|nr:ABC transporter permease [Bacteroidota bacterium]
MIKNYFKTAWRNLMKNKFYSAINISGLAIGLSVGIMILLWVQDELSYDGFHKNAANIYKINSHISTGADAQVWEGAPAPLSMMAKQSIPEVVNTVRVGDRWEEILFVYGNKKFIEKNSAWVDSTFFNVFDFKLIKGNPAKPFVDDNSIVVNESLAKKYFGTVDALGKILVNGKDNFVVSGVMQDFPQNSTLQYDMLFPMSLYGKQFTASGGNGDWKTIDEDLGDYYHKIFIQVRNNASSENVAKKITKLFHDKRGEHGKDNFFTLQALNSMHLVASDGNTGALQNVRIFLVVAILILTIACINYVNLSTARAMLRSKEVSVRKMIGAARAQLFIQFIIESALLFVCASLLAFVIIYLLLPLYNNISGKHLLFSLTDANVWIVVGTAILGTLIMASIYPALLLSSFKPIEALKGKLSFGIGNASFRKILVVTQFIFSVGLIIATIVISYQLKYIRDKNLGFDKEHVFSFNLRENIHNHYAAARAELLKQPGILGVTSANGNLAGVNGATGDTDWDGKENGRMFIINVNTVDEEFIPLFKMQLVAGKNFTDAKTDSAHFILNETAVKQAGIKDPIGKSFTLWQTKGTIVGVVKDFNYLSLKKAVDPAIFKYGNSNWRMSVKTTGQDASKAIAATEAIWKQYSSDYPLEYTFLDDDFNQMYKSEQQTGTLFNVFAGVAIIISCLGLFGLATYTAEVRMKEIGIRKVLGASVFNITNLLAKDFIILILISFLIASPIAWFAMNKWLQSYVYRIHVSGWIFLLTAALAILIALLTVSFQAIKAAMTNPVKTLRSE